jgi:hypothetical protein
MQILEVAYLSLTSIGGKALPPWAELPRELPGVLTGDWRDTPQFHTAPSRKRGERARIKGQEVASGKQIDAAAGLRQERLGAHTPLFPSQGAGQRAARNRERATGGERTE